MTASDDEAPTIVALAERIRSGTLSSVALTHAFLERTRALNGTLNAFISVLEIRALAEAEEADRGIRAGRYRGPLHGIPYGLKDLSDVRGLVTTAGSRINGGIATKDATVVARLRDAGAVLLGKTNLHEFAFGPLGTNPHYGDARNPWDTRRHSGGSSGGSAAAVAAELCAFAIGSDTTGSIRIPSAFCGVVGLKPTYGRVSTAGTMPLAWSLDHIGPICRTAADAAIVLQAIAGRDDEDAMCSHAAVPDYRRALEADIDGLRIGVLADCLDASAPDVRLAFERSIDVLRGLGANIETLRVTELASSATSASAIVHAEALAFHARRIEGRLGEISDDVRERFAMAQRVTDADYADAQRMAARLADRFNEVFRDFDAVVCPTEPITAPRFAQDSVTVNGTTDPKAAVVTRFTRLFNLTGHPAITIGCGPGADGMPVAMQIAAGSYAEATVLRIAHAYQQVTEWHRARPRIEPD